MSSPNTLRVLGVCELLDMVAEQLSYRDLAVFAQVAQVVSNRCLDLLWKRLPTAFPLLSLLPSVIMLNGQYVRTALVGIISTR